MAVRSGNQASALRRAVHRRIQQIQGLNHTEIQNPTSFNSYIQAALDLDGYTIPQWTAGLIWSDFHFGSRPQPWEIYHPLPHEVLLAEWLWRIYLDPGIRSL